MPASVPPPAPGHGGPDRDDRELLLRAEGGDRTALDLVADRLRCVPRILAVLNRRRGAQLSPVEKQLK